MSNPADEIAAIEVGCRVLGIALEPAWHDAVLFNVRAISQQANAVLAPPIPDTVDPAPVFRA